MMLREFQDFPNGMSSLSEGMRSGLLTNVWDEDTAAVNEKLLREKDKPKAMRESPFRGRAAILNSVQNPRDNPWWILFGYMPERNCWQAGDYDLLPIAGVARITDRATDLHQKMLLINTSSWSPGNQVRWRGLTAFVDAGRRGALPGYPWIAWGQLLGKEFELFLYEDPASGIVNSYATPKMTSHQDLLQVAEDGMAAIYRFMYEAGLAVMEVSLPSQHALLVHVPDSLTESNLKTLNSFLQSSSLTGLLDRLRSLGGVHDVFKSSALLEAGTFETVTGLELFWLCSQFPETFVEDLDGRGKSFFAQIAGEFFVGAHLEWDTTLQQSNLKLEKMDGRRMRDEYNCTVKENMRWKSSRNQFSIFHGKVSGSQYSYSGQATEEWYPDRAIVLRRPEATEYPHVVLIQWCAKSDTNRKLHWVKCAQVPHSVRQVCDVPGRLTKVYGRWVKTSELGQGQWRRRDQQWQARFFTYGRISDCWNFRISEIMNVKV